MSVNDLNQRMDAQSLLVAPLVAKVKGLEGQVAQTRGRQRARLEADLATTLKNLRRLGAEFVQTLSLEEINAIMHATAKATAEHLHRFKDQKVRAFPFVFGYVESDVPDLRLFEIQGHAPESERESLYESFTDETVMFQPIEDGQLSVIGSADTLIRWIATVTGSYYSASALLHLIELINSLREITPEDGLEEVRSTLRAFGNQPRPNSYKLTEIGTMRV